MSSSSWFKRRFRERKLRKHSRTTRATSSKPSCRCTTRRKSSLGHHPMQRVVNAVLITRSPYQELAGVRLCALEGIHLWHQGVQMHLTVFIIEQGGFAERNCVHFKATGLTISFAKSTNVLISCDNIVTIRWQIRDVWYVRHNRCGEESHNFLVRRRHGVVGWSTFTESPQCQPSSSTSLPTVVVASPSSSSS